jgi:hypothetical protein
MKMVNYMWRVTMTDSTSDVTTVALFLLENDAREWAAKENKNDDVTNYSVLPPRKMLT